MYIYIRTFLCVIIFSLTCEQVLFRCVDAVLTPITDRFGSRKVIPPIRYTVLYRLSLGGYPWRYAMQ